MSGDFDSSASSAIDCLCSHRFYMKWRFLVTRDFPTSWLSWFEALSNTKQPSRGQSLGPTIYLYHLRIIDQASRLLQAVHRVGTCTYMFYHFDPLPPSPIPSFYLLTLVLASSMQTFWSMGQALKYVQTASSTMSL